MRNFESPEALRMAYMDELQTAGLSRDAARLIASRDCKYIPHIYRGGFMVAGFGYSTERIGRYVSRYMAGSPQVVEGGE